MYKVIFNYQSIDFPVQCLLNEKIKDVYKRIKSEKNLNLANPFFIYNGMLIDIEKTFQELANIQDKERKIMNIIVDSENKSVVEEKCIKSKEIICSECGENCLLNINKYKFNLYGCKQKHQKNDILINKYEETQKIDESKILCSMCKKNKYKIEFFICGICNLNLCQKCKGDHKKGHKILPYKDRFYKCNKHIKVYSRYCETCNLNICVSCAIEHKNHNVINLKEITLKKQDLLNDIINFKKKIYDFNNNVKDFMNNLESMFENVVDNMKTYIKIYEEIIDNYDEMNNLNYNAIQNIKEFKKYNNTIVKDINEFIKDKNIYDRINNIMKIYNNMNNKADENNIKKENQNIQKKEIKPFKNNFINSSKKSEKEKNNKVDNIKKNALNKTKQNNISNNKKPKAKKNDNNKESGYYDFTKEFIFIHVGQAGIGLGNSMWELFSLEHGIYKDETREDMQPLARKIFTEAKNGKFYANSIFIDSDPTNIDKIQADNYNYLFELDSFVSGNGDSSKNYAKGYFKIGQKLIDTSMNGIRKLVEKCSNLGGFILTNAVGGGTGSGCGSLVMENLCINYDKKLRITFPIYPSPKLSNNCNEPYNCVFSTHELLEFSDIAITLDNEALYDIVKNKLDIDKPNYLNLNRLAAHVISSFINSEKDDNPVNCNIKGLIDYLIPSPRLHFMLSSYSPVLSVMIASFEQLGIKNITNYVFEPNSMMVKLDSNSLKRNKYIKCGLIYRGDAALKEVFNYMNIFPTKKTFESINMNPSLFKYNFSYYPPSVVPGGDLPKVMRDVCMISNHTVMNEFIGKFNNQFDKMYNKKENIQLYLNEDMEEAEFKEARENLAKLVNEYEEYQFK